MRLHRRMGELIRIYRPAPVDCGGAVGRATSTGGDEPYRSVDSSNQATLKEKNVWSKKTWTVKRGWGWGRKKVEWTWPRACPPWRPLQPPIRAAVKSVVKGSSLLIALMCWKASRRFGTIVTQRLLIIARMPHRTLQSIPLFPNWSLPELAGAFHRGYYFCFQIPWTAVL